MQRDDRVQQIEWLRLHLIPCISLAFVCLTSRPSYGFERDESEFS